MPLNNTKTHEHIAYTRSYLAHSLFERAAALDHLGPVLTHSAELGLGRVRGTHDDARQARFARHQRHALRVIAGRRRDDPRQLLIHLGREKQC